MPACTCPHCQTHLWVNDAEIEAAKGFAVCHSCEGMFKAKENLTRRNKPHQSENPHKSVTGVRPVRENRVQAGQGRQLSRNEIADLLDGMIAKTPAAAAKKDGFNWTLASLIALTVLIMQLFYLILLI